MSIDYLLQESAVGYALFRVRLKGDTVGARLKEVQEAHSDLARFGKTIELVSFAPFQNAAHALENVNEISEGILSDYLRTVLESGLPKGSKKKKVVLGVSEKGLAGEIKATFPGVECETSDTSVVVADLIRALRLHSIKLLKNIQDVDIDQAQLGLGHAYSRGKVKFSVQRNDINIIQAIAALDHAVKVLNTYSMRLREWYGWHFPELIKVVSENEKYVKCALFIGDKKKLSDDSLDDLAELVDDDESVARAIIDAAKVSMGHDVSDADMECVMKFAERVVQTSDVRKSLTSYLASKMNSVAPNVAALLGDIVGARLISHAGSLANLAKAPASTVQILGAEKALFRALKTKGKTPKYGILYNSTYIGRAGSKNKGRISRFLANKVSIASRIDNFSTQPTRAFGDALKTQVEERLRFYAEGVNPTKNEDAMKKAMDTALAAIKVSDPTAAGAEEEIDAPGVTSGALEQKRRKKKSEDGGGDK